MDVPRAQNKWKRRLTRGGVATGLLAVLGGITLGVSHLKPAEPIMERASVVIDTVKRGSFLREVRGYGSLVPEDMHWIPARTQGRVDRIVLRPGAIVHSDSIILEMTNPEVERDAAAAQLDVNAAEADYAALKVQLEKSTLDEKATLAGVESSYEQAELNAKLDEELAAEGLIPKRDLQIAELAAKEQTTRREVEQKRLEINEDDMKAQLAARAARLDETRAIAKLKQEDMEALHVRSGMEGVLALLPVDEGQQVTPGMNLARVADPHRLKAQIKIAETDAKDVRIGQPAVVDTHNGLIQGTVSRIDPAVQDGSVTVDLSLKGNLPEGARQDLSVDGTIELDHLENVLYMGRPAFSTDKSTVGVYKLEPGGSRASRVQANFGRSSVNDMEILSGLNAGDQVILSDMSAWESFDHVRLH